jgi:hypothetical protein
MADQITKILIRKGSNDDRQQVVLDQAELGYTTDFKRVFVGDGITLGGNTVGSKYFGEVNLDTNVASLSEAEYGDMVFDTSESTLSILSGSNNVSKENYLQVSNINKGTVTRIDVGDGLIFNVADTFITSTGTLNLNLDRTKLNPLVTYSEGLLFDYNIQYPVGSVIWTSAETNPKDPGGRLEGAGQDWIGAGSVNTSSGGTVYAWIRVG